MPARWKKCLIELEEDGRCWKILMGVVWVNVKKPSEIVFPLPIRNFFGRGIPNGIDSVREGGEGESLIDYFVVVSEYGMWAQ